MGGRVRGILRSLVIYHGQPAKHRRAVRLYREFLAPGDLGFDIGAHVGGRVRTWRRLGARVLAVEPQPDCLRTLGLFFGRDRHVTIVPVAVGAEPGRATLALSTATPTVSSLSPDWIRSVSTDGGFRRVRWDRRVEVPVTTLDRLIAEHGEPAFCKIDVEGFELDVLRGLSRPLRALSFEYLPPAHDAALAALRLVGELGAPAGGYVYNYSPVETMRFASDRWLDAADLARLLERYRPSGRSGDVYARLRPAGAGVSPRSGSAEPERDPTPGAHPDPTPDPDAAPRPG
ncbi:FkbM family methyltransferase [Plantactinospora sp. KBS50]|uniref:FkbM family methyltransferase n=1 Tax=Plantactinospora sp. KBS50 TaxID=2024580 RepID=UPI000BAAD39F|nr:FkbM family methyltransferase [Plantactinospora sp. KBS50]ASW55324.1 methyltransferase [Plantactinospora sp. KBS50]